MSTSYFQGKIAIVTGGSKGIGRATTIALANTGCQVVFTYTSDSDACTKLVTEIGQDKVIGIKSNAGNIDDIEHLIQTVVEKFGRIDIIIANAGISPAIELADTTPTDFDDAYNINVRGPFFLVQKAAAYMPPGSHITLVSTSLLTTSQVPPDKLLYCSTKGAVEQMTRLLAKDLGRREIAVNCMAPGPTATELFYKGKSEQLIKTIAEFSPYKRIGTPEETAEVLVFLSGKSSSWISGQVLRVNGGSA